MACQTVWLSCQTIWPSCEASWPNLNWPNSTQNGCRNLGFWEWHYSKFWWFQRLFENLATNSIFSYFLPFEVKKQQCKKVNYIFKCPLQYFFKICIHATRLNSTHPNSTCMLVQKPGIWGVTLQVILMMTKVCLKIKPKILYFDYFYISKQKKQW